MYQCSCPENDFEMGTVGLLQNCQMTSTSEISTNSYEPNSVTNISHVQSLHSDSDELLSTCMFPTVSLDSSNSLHELPIELNFSNKGINMGHLNISGICCEKLGKVSEIQALLTSPQNNNVHVFEISQVKLKGHKSTNVFEINGFQTPFRKDNCSNGGAGLIVYVKIIY